VVGWLIGQLTLNHDFSPVGPRASGYIKLRIVGEPFWAMLGDLAPNAAMRCVAQTLIPGITLTRTEP